MVNQCLINIQDYLFPARCVLCQSRIASRQQFCDECERSLPRVQTQCAVCGAAIPHSHSVSVCGQCQRHPPAYQRTLPALAYRAPITKLVVDLKYHGKLHLARVLGKLLADAVCAAGAEIPDMIIPVPLHRTRLRSRGYNQALEIARPIGKRLDIPVNPRLVRRTRDTGSQTDLPRKDRAKNVRGAFDVRGNVEGLSIAIVDDVMTTGHTVNSVAECLTRANAKSVSVWVVART
jgi:ComF family protein